MILDKRGAPFPGRVLTFGHPFHGLVSGGQLTLPNAEVMDYPQPHGWPGEPDSNGATYLIEVPGVPPVMRNTEQQAIDAAKGYQWLNQAIMSGARHQLYGTPMNGQWIYIDPTGERWAINLQNLNGGVVSFASPLEEEIAATRFGYFTRPAEVHYAYATISSWGQDAPVLNLGGATPNPVNANAYVASTNPDGSQAIIMLYKPYVNEHIVRRPLGFLLVTLAGTPGVTDPGDGVPFDVTIEVLRTRAQTVGAHSADMGDDPVYFSAGYSSETTFESGTVEGCGTRFTSYETLPNAPSWGVGADFNAPQMTKVYDIQMTGRIVAMWFNGDVIEEAAIDVSLSGTWNVPLPTLTASGRVYAEFSYNGACEQTETIIENTLQFVGERTITCSENYSWTLRVGTEELTFTGDFTLSAFLRKRMGPAGEVEQTSSVTAMGTCYGESISYTDGGTTNDPIFSWNWPASPGGWFSTGTSDTNKGFFADRAEQPGMTTTHGLYAMRYANHLIGCVRTDGYDYTDPGLLNRLVGAFYPGGVDPATVNVTGPHRYGSWNPITGEAARGYDQPVCWV